HVLCRARHCAENVGRRRAPAVAGPDGAFCLVGWLRCCARGARFRAAHRFCSLGRTRAFRTHNHQGDARGHRTTTADLSHRRVLRARHTLVARRLGLSPGISFAGVNNMKLAGLLVLILIAASVLVFTVSAQTSLSQWPYYVDGTPEKSEPGL